MVSRPFKDETEMVIAHIRKNTAGKNEWIPIAMRDLPKLFGISQIYFGKLMGRLKEHPNLLYEYDEHFASRHKPYQFRWTDNVNEKIRVGLTKKQFYWLSEEEIDYIKNTSATDQYAKLSKILQTCNLLAGEGGREWWVPINTKELSDVTVSTVKETERRIIFLMSKNLLIKAKHHNYYHLALDPDHLLNIIMESEQKTIRVKPKIERKKRKPELHVVDNFPIDDVTLTASESLVPEVFVEFRPKDLDKTPAFDVKSIQEEQLEHKFANDAQSSSQQNTGVSSLLNNVLATKQSALSVVQDIQALFTQISELQKQEEANKQSYEAFLKLGSEYDIVRTENEALKEKLHSYETKLSQFDREIKLLCEYNEAFLGNAQARMDVLLGIISGYLDEYVLRPKYEKSDELINARLKKNIWAAVESTSSEITNFKPESKLPPNMR